jgi:arylsulfatase A-like enzyme/Flp pilus assembly protein TadD
MRVTMPGALLIACSGGPAAPPAEAPAALATATTEKTPNVVMVTLDTVRADRLGAWGYPKARTDTLDALAAAGRRYARAYSPLPLTIPSHAAMMTGRYPAHVGIRSNGDGTLGDAETTLAELLGARGWHTGAAVSAFVTTRIWGFSQGFEAFFDKIPQTEDNFWHGERTGKATVDDALAWVGSLQDDRPVFLWVHMYDAHFPYTPPEDYLQASEGRPYDAEIAILDDQVARLVEAFRGEPTLFVIAGDHGEGLGDHGELNHGLFAYDVTQHVPLLFSGPGVKPEVVEQPASLVDLAPTLLGLLGIEPPEGMDGSASPKGPVYMEAWQLAERYGVAPHRAVVDGNLKLVATPRPELYDLSADPGELTDLASQRAADVARLQGLLDGFGFAEPTKKEADIDPSVREQLAQLGYVDGGGVENEGPRPDPKDRKELIALSQKADRQIQLQEITGAIATLKQLIRENPQIMEFRNRLASLLTKEKRLDEARAVMEEALKIDPDNPSLRLAHAGMLAQAGKLDEAVAVYRVIAEEQPFTPRIRAMVVHAIRQSNKLDEAIAAGQEYRLKYPDDQALAGILGVLLVERGRPQEAYPLLELGVQAAKPEMDVAWLLGARAVTEGDLEGALRLYGQELEVHPYNLKAAAARARVALKLGRWAEQLDSAEKMLAGKPDDAEMWHLSVLALFNLERYADARAALEKGLKVDPGYPELLLMDANLLAKEGRMEEGKKRFAEAQAALQARAAKAP